MIRAAIESAWAEPRSPGAPPPLPRDWVLVGVFVTTAVVEVVLRDDVVWAPVATAVTIAVAISLPWRRLHPLATVVLGFGSALAMTAAAWALGIDQEVGLNTTVFVLLLPYALMRWGSGRQAVVGSGLIVVTATLGLVRESTGTGDVIGAAVVLLLPAVLGLAVRWRDHAHRRELEQVKLEERGQLARELHDIVAHHVSAIVIRAQAGRAVAASDPDAAVDALGVIEGEAARTLAQMRAMVGVLREGLPADLAPQRGLGDIAGLARAEPVPAIEVELPTAVETVSPTIGAALFRIAQESVTNALRHAHGATRVTVRVSDEGADLRIQVRDDGAAEPGGLGSGYGLVGMNERATLLGGQLSAGPQPGGGWLVDAVLPREVLPRDRAGA
ncbi:sensor histidine kinase [Nocardioides sp.]|uniref:sensor histidine kinase n=1 Tax=Nocardioides sp. TaxID=35761 RepID=UPI002ED7EB17